MQKTLASPHDFTKRGGLRPYVFVPLLLIEVPVPNKESEWSCICVLGVYNFSIGIWKCFDSVSFYDLMVKVHCNYNGCLFC